MDTMTIAGRVKAIRKAMGLSQEQFGAKIGKSTALVCKLESGERKVTEQIKNTICTSCRVSEPYLMEGTGEMFSNEPPKKIIDDLARQINMSEVEKIFLITYLEMDDAAQKTCSNFLKKFVSNYFNYNVVK